MPESRKFVRVFLASPGDLGAERQAAKAVVDEFNSTWGEFIGYHIKLVGWEDTVSVFGRPQATINRELETCDLFIGMMWRKWGTPPSLSGPYTSGFEEEFRTSVERCERTSSPGISLFFKNIPSEYMSDPGDDLKKVLKFKQELIDSKKIYFETFGDISDFQMRIRRLLGSYIQKLSEAGAASDSNQMAPTQPTVTSADLIGEGQHKFLPISGKAFLLEVINGNGDDEDPNGKEVSVQIARLRLLSSISGTSFNDSITLGVHDANLIRISAPEKISDTLEMVGLVDSALYVLGSQAAPLWYWYKKLGSRGNFMMALSSLVGPDRVRQGALRIMRLLGIDIPRDNENLTASRFFESWFDRDRPGFIRNAAADYLSDWGGVDAIEPLVREYEKNDYQTKHAVSRAIFKILLKYKKEEVNNILRKLQPDGLDECVVKEIVSEWLQVDDESFKICVSMKNARSRMAVLEVLVAKGLATKQILSEFTLDVDVVVRSSAIKFLMKSGSNFSDTELKSALVRKNRSILGAISSIDPAVTVGEDYFELLRASRLSSLSNEDLNALVESAVIFDVTPYLVRANALYSKYEAELKINIKDRFRDFIELSVDRVSVGLERGELTEKVRSLMEFTGQEMARRALDIVARRRNKRDLAFIRENLGVGDLPLSIEDIHFIGEFGEWGDIPLMLKSSKLAREISPLFGDIVTKAERASAIERASYLVGRRDIGRLFGLENVSDEMKISIIKMMSDVEVRLMPEGVRNSLLKSENEELRRVSVLSIVRAVPRRVILEIWKAYIELENDMYYNVVFWLDCGVVLPKAMSKRYAAAAMAVLD